MLSLGAQYRQEILDTALGPDYASTPGYLADYSRHVAAGFAEVRFPIISETNAYKWTRRLELSLGSRYERYPAFGGVLAPKFGALWTPNSRVDLRGTWGRAFRPPTMPDLDESHNQSGIGFFSSPSSQPVSVLWWSGGNSGLQLERSDTWTLGADFTPTSDLSLSATYFSITDRGRIDELLLTGNPLSDPTFLGSIIWQPTIGQRQQVCSHSTFYGPNSACLSAPVIAIVDLRAQNLDTLKTSGVDMSGRYALEGSLARLTLGIDATYLLRFSQAHGRAGQFINLLNIQHEPIDWRTRGKLAWKKGSFTATTWINFSDSYRDTASVPSRPVSSWTTVDFDLEYAPADEGPSWLKGTTLGVSAQNVGDSRAPFLNNAATLIGYDQENASLVGRVLGFRIRHKW